MQPDLLLQVALALGLGLLIGLEREWASKRIAGVRTFPLITLFGWLAAVLVGPLGPWLVPAGLLGLTFLLGLANRLAVAQGRDVGPGLTTEVTVLVAYLLGAAIGSDLSGIATVVAGIVVLLLHFKGALHGVVERVGPDDFRALARLVLIGMIILPVLPDRGFGPNGRWNPHQIWLVVVLIVGISLVAYIARKLLGSRAGAVLSGILGGLISSTAITIGAARRSRSEGADWSAPLVIMIASTVALVRILVEIATLAPSTLDDVAPPLGAFALWMATISAVAYWARRRGIRPVEESEKPPAELWTAISFALLYGGVLFGVAWVEERFGHQALLLVAGVSGLTDVDAITLSLAELMAEGSLDHELGWRAILIAAAANLVFKGGIAAVLGTRRLFARLSLLFGLSLLGGAAIYFMWPSG
ncbi:MAG: MgtC/SapB family protein [Planctomycetota bacterium]